MTFIPFQIYFLILHNVFSVVLQNIDYVKAGDELTISYIDVSEVDDVDARTKLLYDKFGFVCFCARCSAERNEKRLMEMIQEQEEDEEAGNSHECYDSSYGHAIDSSVYAGDDDDDDDDDNRPLAVRQDHTERKSRN
jgi:hypothetical protein